MASSSYYPSISNPTVIGRYMYSKYSGANCYRYPSESSGYYHGRLSLYEQVYAIEGNGTWTKITVDGYTVYTRTSNLTYDIGGWYDPDYGYGYGYGYGGYYGNRARVFANTRVYSDYEGNTFQRTTPENMYVTIVSYTTGTDYVRVSYYDYSAGVSVDGYIHRNDLYY